MSRDDILDLGPEWRVDRACSAGVADPWTLVLAHGAGQGMDSPFLESMARLIAAWHETLDRLLDGGLGPERLVIGGKSLGGRMASLVALERPVAGLVCLGCPFHPPGRPEQTRVEHLRDLQVPTLICQGTRDPFGRPEEVAGYGLSAAIRLVWIEDGEHSLKPGPSSGRTWDRNLAQAADAVVSWTTTLCPPLSA